MNLRVKHPGWREIPGSSVAAGAPTRAADYFWVGIEVDKGGWFSKYANDALFQEYLGRVRARPGYLRAKAIQDASPVLA